MRTVCAAVLLALAGCGGPAPGGANPAAVPLTLADWKGLPAERKYSAESYERLKLGEPKFQDEKAWDQFYRTVVLPGRKRDLPAETPKR